MSQLAVIEGGSMDSGSDDEVLGIALLTVLLSRRQKKRRSKRKMWVNSILSQCRQRRIPHAVTGNVIKRYPSTFHLLADVERAF